MVQIQQPIAPIVSQNTISVHINSANLHQVIDFLVQQQLPFELKYDLPPATTASFKPISNPTPEPITAAMPLHKANKTADTIQAAYQKYIVKGVGQSSTAISQIAKELRMSVSKFNALFKAHYGESFYTVLLSYRMKHAAELLKKGHKCNEVTQMVGYGEKSAIKFNKMFQRHFGITPKKYQMSQKQ